MLLLLVWIRCGIPDNNADMSECIYKAKVILSIVDSFFVCDCQQLTVVQVVVVCFPVYINEIKE